MAAATVTEVLEGVSAEENVVLTVTDGETYTSKLSSIVGVQATGQEDVDAHLNCTISGRTITINYAGQTDKKVFLTIKGRL